ncbi:MAG: hypothetical protein JXR22_10665 [Prolixibacteraceae bacterium]|nr:hypothetical protein [Prolixibacteraceae bacterium]
MTMVISPPHRQGILFHNIIAPEHQGSDAIFGEPSFDVNSLMYNHVKKHIRPSYIQ